jgi:hypothetical protein
LRNFADRGVPQELGGGSEDGVKNGLKINEAAQTEI